MKTLSTIDTQLAATIKSLMISIQDGAENFSCRAFHIRGFLNSLDKYSLCGYTGSDTDCLLNVYPRLEKLLVNVSNNTDSVNYNLFEQHQWEKAKIHLKGMNFNFFNFKTKMVIKG